MRTVRIILILLTLVCLPFIADSKEERSIKRIKPSGTSERRTALLIGNSAYNAGPLKTPVEDARDMAYTLSELGFTVIHKENAGLREMEESVADFGKQLRQGGAGLFYFAGHGVQVKGNNYLIPTDAEIKTEADVRYKAMDARQVLDKMDDAGNSPNIVILDACRDNPFSRSFASARNGLAEMTAPTGSVVIFATGANSVAADGEGRNGVFTKHLLNHIRAPGLKLEEVMKSVRKDVAQETGGKQVPWEHSSLRGDFYFADISSEAAEKTKLPEPLKMRESFLRISADISDAEVFINGEKYGQLPGKFALSEPGMYEVEVIAPGYKKFRVSKKIELGKEYEVAVRLEKESPEPTASKPETVTYTARKPKYPLRKTRMTVSDEDAWKTFELKKDTDGRRRPLEYEKNDYVDNGNGTITDSKTGLMWQKSGLPKPVYHEGAKEYVENLNRDGFAGHRDWRLPTVDELKSLLIRDKNGDSHIDPIFDKTQRWCWTSDQRASGGAWGVGFDDGEVDWDHLDTGHYVRAVRSGQ